MRVSHLSIAYICTHHFGVSDIQRFTPFINQPPSPLPTYYREHTQSLHAMSNGNRMVSKKTPTPVAAAGAPKTTTNAASNATTTAAGAEGAKPRPGGALMLKTVSLFLASSRRFSAQARAAQGANQATARRRAGRKMDAEASGKLTPKQLETLKKRTHFTQ